MATSFYLIVSRLVPQKRLDVAIKAFNEVGLPLKIVGIGKEYKSLKSISNPNIEFLGYLTDQELKSYYESCLAVVIPGEEDFNIVAVEAQSFGKPVIAYNKGGVTETVIENKTGWFFNSFDELLKKIKNPGKIDPKDCLKNAKKYSKARFEKEFLNYVRNLKTNN